MFHTSLRNLGVAKEAAGEEDEKENVKRESQL
jgi:hypothetical protein